LLKKGCLTAWRSIRQLSAKLEDETVGDCNRLESVLYPHGSGHRAIHLPPIMESEVAGALPPF